VFYLFRKGYQARITGFGLGLSHRLKGLPGIWVTEEQKAAIKLFSMDMHGPFKAAIRDEAKLEHAAIVHDPFHVMKRASEAVDELRRQVFFRNGPEMRALGRGKRWLFKRAWANCSPAQKEELAKLLRLNGKLARAYQLWANCSPAQKEELGKLLRLNGKLARAYQLVEQLRDVLRAPDEITMFKGLMNVLRRTERRDNEPMRKLHESIDRHFTEILALGKHRPPTGRVEALNNNWETQVRLGRGYRDLDHLLLKLRFAIANPIRTEGRVLRFLALGLPVPDRKAA